MSEPHPTPFDCICRIVALFHGNGDGPFYSGQRPMRIVILCESFAQDMVTSVWVLPKYLARGGAEATWSPRRREILSPFGA